MKELQKNFRENAAAAFAGIDMGSAVVRLAVLDANGNLVWKDKRIHHGNPAAGTELLLARALDQFGAEWFGKVPVMLTGSSTAAVGNLAFQTVGDIPAIQKGAELLYPGVKSVIEIGAQNARYLTGLGRNMPPLYAVNEGCAGGTGSFFEDQMYRLGCRRRIFC